MMVAELRCQRHFHLIRSNPTYQLEVEQGIRHLHGVQGRNITMDLLVPRNTTLEEVDHHRHPLGICKLHHTLLKIFNMQTKKQKKSLLKHFFREKIETGSYQECTPYVSNRTLYFLITSYAYGILTQFTVSHIYPISICTTSFYCWYDTCVSFESWCKKLSEIVIYDCFVFKSLQDRLLMSYICLMFVLFQMLFHPAGRKGMFMPQPFQPS